MLPKEQKKRLLKKGQASTKVQSAKVESSCETLQTICESKKPWKKTFMCMVLY